MIREYSNADGVPDPVPEAIFWRPLDWFSSALRLGSDELDEFRYVTFEIGNWLRFDLRTYLGHPSGTTTLYIGLNFGDSEDIGYAIDRASSELNLPKTAIGWRHGVEFEYGKLPRDPGDRLREPEARLIALKVAALSPNRTATTEQLIEGATKLFTPSAIDLKPSRRRRLQPQWHQIMRNVISHRTSPHGPFEKGYAVRTANGMSVTDNGMDYLSEVGFITAAD